MAERPMPEHVLAYCSSPARPGEWVQCSCGWASPDISFPTPEDAIQWAQREHPESDPAPGAEQVDPDTIARYKETGAGES
ncbi:MAG TPA: hypothetical protein VMB51_05325 [Solirubrobacteraceae bacterium]|nr:hypothetical protein [Solirubrobacteraceae bacterium]